MLGKLGMVSSSGDIQDLADGQRECPPGYRLRLELLAACPGLPRSTSRFRLLSQGPHSAVIAALPLEPVQGRI